MPIARYPLEIDQGESFARIFTWKTGPDALSAVPVDLTGCTARLQVRADARAPTAAVDISTTGNSQGAITLGGTAGTVQVEFEPAATALWLDGYGYGLEIVSGDGTKTAFLEGPIKMNAGWIR